MDFKTPEDSKTINTDVVMPVDTNSLNNLFGGELLSRMDKVASIAAVKHSEQIVVTASINNVAFGEPVPNGSILTIEAKVSRAFKSSMEVVMDIWIEDRESGTRKKSNVGIYTFVAVDESGQPVSEPAIIPESDLEKDRFEAALRRRQLSLVIAGKMDASDATELKALFN